jgi:hypothetical protein
MNIVLVSITNFQDYILSNIDQLIRLNHKNIYVLTNKNLFINFSKYDNLIRLIDIDELTDTYNFYLNTHLDKSFRNGFWTLTSLRFFYIYEFMKKYNINDVIHLENDVLIYYNCDILINKLDKDNIYIPFDTFNRNIASIMYIPSANIFKLVLDNYDMTKNDMENFSIIKQKIGLINIFPIFNDYLSSNNEISFVSTNYNNFNFIFDAAAIGQYLGGVDPRNDKSDTVGFINETCIIKYNIYDIHWIIIDNINKPFITINNNIIPIFNLHIHSKKLYKFI